MSKKLGLCLGAGGARGVAHAGFLQALIENNIPIDVVTGCSMGSIVGALFLSGYTPEQMMEVALDLKKRDLLDVKFKMVKNRAILKSKKLDKLLKKLFGDKTFKDLSKPFACIATDLYSATTYCFKDGLVRTAIRASSSIPTAFTPVKHENMLLVDGSITNRTPIGEARELGADVVVAVDVLTNLSKEDEIKNILSVGIRAIDIMCANINPLDKAQIPDLLITPDLGIINQYALGTQQYCYEKGYEAGIKYIPKIKELLQ